jgi:hypothetical protein
LDASVVKYGGAIADDGCVVTMMRCSVGAGVLQPRRSFQAGAAATPMDYDIEEADSVSKLLVVLDSEPQFSMLVRVGAVELKQFGW